MILYMCVHILHVCNFYYISIYYICVLLFPIIRVYYRKRKRAGQEKGRWAVYGETCSIYDTYVCVCVCMKI